MKLKKQLMEIKLLLTIQLQLMNSNLKEVMEKVFSLSWEKTFLKGFDQQLVGVKK